MSDPSSLPPPPGPVGLSGPGMPTPGMPGAPMAMPPGTPVGAPKKSKAGLIVALVALLVVVAIGGTVAAVIVGRGDSALDVSESSASGSSGSGSSGSGGGGGISKKAVATTIPKNVLGESSDIVVLEGTGNAIVDMAPPSGPTSPFVVRFTNQPSDQYGTFSAQGLDASGGETVLFVSGYNAASGIISGTELENIYTSVPSDAPTTLKVEASGTWKVELIPVKALETWDGTASISGSGGAVYRIAAEDGLADPVSATATFESATPSSDPYGRVTFYGFEPIIDQLTTVGDSESGPAIVPAGTLLVEITGDGPWSLIPG